MEKDMKKKKGEYGSIKYRRKLVILRTILYFSLSLAIFAAGYLSAHDRRNLLTVVAVLGLLPASKSLVNMIMFLKAKGCSQNAYAVISPFDQCLFPQYDLYITSYQKNFDISHIVIKGQLLLGYTEDPKCDLTACREFLVTACKQGGVKDISVTITNHLDTYCEFLRNLSEKEAAPETEKEKQVRSILMDIAL